MGLKRCRAVVPAVACLWAAWAFAGAQAAPASLSVAADPVCALWPDGAPGSERLSGESEVVKDTYVTNVHAPSLTVVRGDARRANGAAVVVVPGGGHRMLVWMNEGMLPAKALSRYGVTAFVLKYRLAREPGSRYSIGGDAAADLRRAIRWVRAHAADYGGDPHRVGVMGFSAGGELVSLVADSPGPGTIPSPSSAPSPDPSPAPADEALDKLSARPDFQVLGYPGPLGVPAKAVTQAPPAFLVAGSVDQCCAAPAIALYQQLAAAGVSAELHLYADTDHAFNLGQRSDRVSIQHWPDRLADWLNDGGWLSGRGDRVAEGVAAPPSRL